MSQGIAITSKANGFRRAGIKHPAQRVVYPADRFTELQLKLLKEEPMLIVEEDVPLPEDEHDEDDDKGKGQRGGNRRKKEQGQGQGENPAQAGEPDDDPTKANDPAQENPQQDPNQQPE
ncbi:MULTISPECIES: HI1506-related protein [Brevibacillus]|uniref:HI1506-related protein n=1 Tax=Brevibacillus TaxID=55080 RepID=UPI000D10E335|nr:MULTISPECIES: HI1506-related protein [Brevibacillus]PSJ66962.1 hypothetical protein C7J99_23045 [Brevibacillus brevis]RED27759.1 hypothetical protein DES34_10951 [Brevibacillus brevis]TQK42125.1 hypothetical protein FB479_115117 [Brevibacillus sp. AG162]VEF86796.1 Uncharacterised protein [Brevibacillus brevis]GEC88599.1 hypothetical protein BBR01nite_09300 [Brevibacillus brevis]